MAVAALTLALTLLAVRGFSLFGGQRALAVTLVNALPDPVLVLDCHLTIIEANAAATALIGGSVRLAGRKLVEIEALSPLARALERGEGPPSDLLLGANQRHFEVSLTELQRGRRQIGRMLTLRDITRRAHLELRLREQATRDPLTGLHNRRLLEEIGARLLLDSDQTGLPVAFIMLDLDHFKRLNDEHGHRAGDMVLRAIGSFLNERVRQTDFVFRTGGEEFLILLPGASAQRALQRIEGWRREFTARQIEIGEEGRVQISFSAGVAVYPAQGASLDDILSEADRALYQAKRQGRNQSCLCPEQMALEVGHKLDGGGAPAHL